jgi:N6-adenosine-specific RNA methylase IME4
MPKYKTIVIDPPWNLKTATSPNIINGSRYKDKLSYESMTTQEILDFPINDFADKDALIFLWVANGRTVDDEPIPELGFKCLQDWGFRYNSMIHWIRNQHTCLWSPIALRTETCLFGWRKQPLDCINSMKNIFEAPADKHSEKPARFYQLLRAWTPTPRIDIFARQAHEGFDGWGNEYVGDGPLAEWIE